MLICTLVLYAEVSWLWVSVQIRTASCSAANCVNTFGDEQLAVDLLADKLLFEALKYSVSARIFQKPLPAWPSLARRKAKVLSREQDCNALL